MAYIPGGGGTAVDEVWIGPTPPADTNLELWYDTSASNTFAEGPQGPPGPSAVSADANNASKLGTDSKIYTSKPPLGAYNFNAMTYLVNTYIDNRLNATAPSGSFTPTANRMYAVPIVVERSVTVDRMSLSVSTLFAGGLTRIGIYNSDPNTGYPTSLIIAGEVDCSTTGLKEVTINQTLNPGTYWLVLFCNNTTNVFLSQPAASTRIATGQTTLTGQLNGAIWATGTYASGLPATWPGTSTGNNAHPAMGVRISALV